MEEFLQMPNDPLVLHADDEPSWTSNSYDTFYNDSTYADAAFPPDLFASTPAPGTPGLSIGSPLKPFTNEVPRQVDHNDATLQQTRPELASSSSPESSSQESSSESSGRGRKRKSSSLSNTFDMLNSIESPMNMEPAEKMTLSTIGPHVYQKNAGGPKTDQDVENMEQRFERGFAFSNHTSPGAGIGDMTIAPSQLEFAANQTHVSQPSTRQSGWIIGSRDDSPSFTASNEASPAANFGPTPPPYTSPSAPLGALQSFSTSNNGGWARNGSNLKTSPTPASAGLFRTLSVPRRESSSGFRTYFRAIPSQWKSRVETQINMTLYVWPLPQEIQKLHLPTVSISKPKFLAKEIVKSRDTLELHTSLVNATAMQNPELRRVALLRAQGVDVKSEADSSGSPMDEGTDGSSEDNDVNKPINGGEVKICENCIQREHKRATRKRTKAQDGEDTWFQYANERIVIFNEKEYQEWKPIDTGKDAIAGEQLPEGTVKINVPTRIACYCRHQSEKIGFQIIFTLKDHNGTVVTQTMTEPILITDDHKTSNSQQDSAPAQPVPNTSLQRPYHSANDLTALHEAQTKFHHHQAPMSFHQRQDSSLSQSASASTVAPSYNSLSRQASPAAHAGPNKRRKGSGSHNHRLPRDLTMTRLDTSQPPSALPNATSAGPLSQGLLNQGFGSSGSFVHPGDLMNGLTMPVSQTSPPTPNTVGPPLTPGISLRNHSGDNLFSFSSVPNSAHASRSGSPVGAMRGGMIHSFQPQPAIATNPFTGQYGATQPTAEPQQQTRTRPVVFKVLPNEGPISGGKEVTCLGAGFTRTTEVYFGGVAATPITYWGPSTLVCLTPPGAKPGPVAVTVRNPENPGLSPPQTHGGNNQAVFTYKDDNESQLFQLVLRVLNEKHQGNPDTFKQFLMNVVDQSNSGWNAAMSGGAHGGYRQMQRSSFGGTPVDHLATTEDILLKCLDVLDMDESPFAPEYNLQSDAGATMLSLSCSMGFTRFVAALLARGADPEVPDCNGFTPLMFAAFYGHVQLVRRLLLKGADPTLRSLRGYLALDLASTDEVVEALQRLPRRSRTRSGGDSRLHSRANSIASLHSIWDTPSPSQVSRRSSKVESRGEFDSDEQSDEIDALPPRIWIQSPKNNPTLGPRTLATPTPVDQVRLLSPAAAMTAWGNQIAAQFQQIQQNVNWNFPNFQLPALPPMPNLPDYQAHPMVRRISQLVPHRTPSRNADRNAETNSNGQDHSWRDAFSSSPLPPSYEEIYPAGSNSAGEQDMKKSAAMSAVAETLLDRKCSELFDAETSQAGSSSKTALKPATEDSDTDLDVRIGKKSLTREEQEKMKRAHAKKLKKIGRDRNLWMIWIPLLLVLLAMMLKNQLFEFVVIAARYTPGSQAYLAQPRVVEVE